MLGYFKMFQGVLLGLRGFFWPKKLSFAKTPDLFSVIEGGHLLQSFWFMRTNHFCPAILSTKYLKTKRVKGFAEERYFTSISSPTN